MTEGLSKIPKRLLDLVRPDSIIVAAPGRINLIGEHTDYNQGWALPAAIQHAAYLVLWRSNDNQRINIRALDIQEEWSGNIDFGPQKENHWANYILGVLDGFRKLGTDISGINITFSSTVPIGSGVSSSAALECAAAFALNQFYGTNLPSLDLALLAQRAEHKYAGVQCGLMDQYASIFGRSGHAILLDCKTETHTYVPVQMSSYDIVLVDSKVKHQLAGSEYNIRRQQCMQGVQWLQKQFPEVKSLRDATQIMLDQEILPKDETIYRRCKFVIEENNRVQRVCKALQQGDITTVGRAMYQSHQGLDLQYEVSCKELDYLIKLVRQLPEVAGARMMGGGFGGCTINLVRKDFIKKFESIIAAKYFAKFGLHPEFIHVEIGPGARQLFL